MATTLAQTYVAAQPIAELTLHPRNPRRGDIARIAASINANGFYGTVMVQRSTGFVIYGNHRLEAARQVGLTTVPALWVEIDDDAAARILLADNATSDAATYDEAELAALLEALVATDLGLAGTGWDQAEMDELLAALDNGTGPESDASLLDISAVGLGDPTHRPLRGDVYRLGPVTHNLGDEPGWTAGPHHLAVVSLASGWDVFLPLLTEGALLLPYPGPYLPVTRLGLRTVTVLVQPESFIAGHLLDKWTELFGAESVVKVA